MSEQKLVIRASGPFVDVELDGKLMALGDWLKNGDTWELLLPESKVRLVVLRSEASPLAVSVLPERWRFLDEGRSDYESK